MSFDLIETIFIRFSFIEQYQVIEQVFFIEQYQVIEQGFYRAISRY